MKDAYRISYLCLFIACLLPIVCTGIAKWGERSYNNRNPRDWLAKQDGYRKRANAAQSNSWEALIIFGLAVVVAAQKGAPASLLNGLAISFVLARLIYIACYLADLHWMRSLIWFVGFFISLAIFWIG